MKELVAATEIPKCPACNGLVKPDIVFFGEALPESFWLRRYDMPNAGISSQSRLCRSSFSVTPSLYFGRLTFFVAILPYQGHTHV
jgi:NAD-dependent SIR2 family protein deacetylase